MSNFRPSSESFPARATQAEAAAWLARLHADDRSKADEDAFRRWLNADPSHAAAFEAVDQVWSAAGALQLDPRTGAVEAAPRRTHRRAILAGMGIVLAAGGTLSFLRPASAKIYQTDVGEQKHIALDDGSQVFLDTQTRVAVDYSDALRSVDLQYGRANFRVVPDASRPFVVEAAQRKIIASHSNFDVRCENGSVQIVLIHGEAAIQSSASAVSATLRSGDRLVAQAGNTTRDKPDLTPLLAWQTGQVIFENVPLSEAVREMNRYSTDKLEIGDAQVAALHVSGAYRVGDNCAFAHSVAVLLAIDVREENNQLLFISQEGVGKTSR